MPTYNHPLLGPVSFRILNDEGEIELLDDTERDIVPVSVPELAGIPLFDRGGQPCSGSVRFHRRGAEQLQAAWREVKQRGLLPQVLTWDGSVAMRLIRGSRTTPSNHAFGTAFDINAGWNGLGVTPPAAGRCGSVRELVPTFEKYGFGWGGNYARRPDGMHFELVRFGVAPLPDAPPSISVFVNGVQQVIPALLIDGRTLVGVRALTKRLGGTLGEIQLDPFRVAVCAARTATLDGRLIDGIGYVPFREVAALYDGLTFQFIGEQKRLDIRV